MPKPISDNYKNSLIQDAHLLSLSKSDCDLFLIAQANTITYSQLEETALHGMSSTGGRLSLKKLEKDGYIASRLIPGTNRMKFFTLTPKGKKRIERLFSSTFLQEKFIDMERRPPTSQAQLPHRIHTNDIFFAYASAHSLAKIPIWILESGYEINIKIKEHLPRCDGLLITEFNSYYIEQDNCTQGDTALDNKIHQYLSSNLFLGENIKKNTLVFSLYAEAKEKPVKKPPFSVYRILLKAIKVWKIIENESSEKILFSRFCDLMLHDTSICFELITPADRSILVNLCRDYPQITLEEAISLKKSFLYDNSLQQTQLEERDLLFQKRLQQKFYRMLDSNNNVTLLHRLQQGLNFYIIPNHQLKLQLPFILNQEYKLKDCLLQFLFSIGLDIDNWKYRQYYTLKEADGMQYNFCNAFTSIKNSIIFEDISNNLGGRHRIRHFLHQTNNTNQIILILFASKEEDALYFIRQEEIYFKTSKYKNISICFFYKKDDFITHPANTSLYAWKTNLFIPVVIDYDSFTCELNLTERR